MLFRTAPKLRFAPYAEVSKFLYLWVIVLDVVFYRQAHGIVHSDLTAYAVKDPCGFECHEFRK